MELLANHFLHKFSAALGKRVQAINAEARGLLYRYPWPGNVRELENAIERAVNVCGGQELMPCDFPSAMLEHEARPEKRLAVGAGNRNHPEGYPRNQREPAAGRNPPRNFAQHTVFKDKKIKTEPR